jgi:hypothetical protein
MERQRLAPAKPKGFKAERIDLNLNLKIAVLFFFTLQAPALPITVANIDKFIFLYYYIKK